VHFRVGALTNITRDHLDFHGTLEAYALAKKRLFAMAQAAVLNLDDPHGARWRPELSARESTVGYAIEHPADVRAHDVVLSANGSTFTVDGHAFSVALPGRFNVSNALAAIGVARTLGIDDATSAALDRVPGRMEHVRGAGIDVVIDYAHTPDALENALSALRETTDGTLVVVFGCGGDRDRGKRPEMGAVAARFADTLYITSDNPRTEDPQSILDDIIRGVGAKKYQADVDRRSAIARAIDEAKPGDVVLIAGKGHETYQEIGTQRFAFNDVDVANEALVAREKRA
jgi:UDP-N-acetylmuramoyl-L-alanyl-D-glutamate--2,6-diaminopimelate ligase